MKVILTEKVPSVGNTGEIVNVSPGYGRNYLIPNNLAVLADEGHKSQLENHQKRLAKKIEEEKKAAEGVKKQIDGLSLELIKKVGANGKLFGSVTTTELSKVLEEKGVHIEKRMITLDNPIKAVGSFKARVKLFTGVEGDLDIKVKMDPKQAEELKAKQAAAEKRAAEKKKAAAEAAEAAKAEGETPKTEEQNLLNEADKVLRED